MRNVILRHYCVFTEADEDADACLHGVGQSFIADDSYQQLRYFPGCDATILRQKTQHSVHV